MGTELRGVSARLQGAWTFAADKTLLHYRGSRGSHNVYYHFVHSRLKSLGFASIRYEICFNIRYEKVNCTSCTCSWFSDSAPSCLSESDNTATLSTTVTMSSSTGPVGYREIQFPDISNNRRRRQNICSLFHQIALDEHLRIHVDNITLDAFILVAYANVLGMYCGATDVLLSLEGLDGMHSPFRLQWDETTTWLNALEVASVGLKQTKQQQPGSPLTSQPLEVLELAADRSPFIAVFRGSSRATSCSPAESPSPTSTLLSRLPLLIHAGDGFLHLHSPSNRFCSSVSSMLLRQIVAVIAQALADATQKLAAPLHLNNDLASVVEALPENERTTCYSHIPPARFATDYILPHSTSNPNATAVQWYPDLSPDAAVLRTPECLTYNDLNCTANRFARFLLGRGLAPEDRVAVSMDRDLVFHSVFLGILRAGGCYVPVSPSSLCVSPCSRLHHTDRPGTTYGKEDFHCEKFLGEICYYVVSVPCTQSFWGFIN
jgi:hypothetical protein